MKKIEVMIIVVAVLLVVVIIMARKTSNENVIEKVCFSEKCFDVEVADSSAEREQGLMNRESLAENSGMLFVFDSEGKHSFWMKDTLIALDMIWINSDMEVVDVQGADPCVTEECEVYTPASEALYVLEINYGVAESLGIAKGSKAELKYN